MKKQPKPQTNVIPALTARTQFGQIMARACRYNERFLVDRRGEPSVLIMSLKDYIDTFAPAPKWLKDMQAQAKRKGLDRLNMRDIDHIIADVRRHARKAKPVAAAGK